MSHNGTHTDQGGYRAGFDKGLDAGLRGAGQRQVADLLEAARNCMRFVAEVALTRSMDPKECAKSQERLRLCIVAIETGRDVLAPAPALSHVIEVVEDHPVPASATDGGAVAVRCPMCPATFTVSAAQASADDAPCCSLECEERMAADCATAMDAALEVDPRCELCGRPISPSERGRASGICHVCDRKGEQPLAVLGPGGDFTTAIYPGDRP